MHEQRRRDGEREGAEDDALGVRPQAAEEGEAAAPAGSRTARASAPRGRRGGGGDDVLGRRLQRAALRAPGQRVAGDVEGRAAAVGVSSEEREDHGTYGFVGTELHEVRIGWRCGARRRSRPRRACPRRGGSRPVAPFQKRLPPVTDSAFCPNETAMLFVLTALAGGHRVQRAVHVDPLGPAAERDRDVVPAVVVDALRAGEVLAGGSFVGAGTRRTGSRSPGRAARPSRPW